MRQPTAELRGSSLGDALGIGWFLRGIGGVAAVGHDGSANGQFASLLTVPDRGFAVAVLSNAGPDGGLAVKQAVARWALEHYLGLADRDAEPLPYDPARAAEIAGSYENDMMTLTFRADGAGLTVECTIEPEIRAATGTELPPNMPPANLGLLPGDAGEYLITSGGLKGQRGFFTRDHNGQITAADFAGRRFTRVPAAAG